MNIYLLEVMGKLISLITITAVSIVGAVSVQTSSVSLNNINKEKSLDIEHEIIPFETKKIFRSNMPTGTKLTKTEGQEGIVVLNGEYQIDLREQINEEVYVGTGPVGKYQGNMTGYGPDCRTCSGRGFVGCRGYDGTYHNLIKDGKYYNDHEYGEIRIVAATRQVFKCGTIVEVKINGEKFNAIVLDRGAAMENHYNNGHIVFDLAFVSEKEDIKEIRAITKNNLNRPVVGFEVKRWGF